MQPFLKSTQLIIDGNPQPLKAPLRRMSSGPSCRRRNAFLNQLGQLSGGLHRAFFPALYNLPGNPP
ncbi:hypothetical protein D3C85_1820830 [compost metagenome]